MSGVEDSGVLLSVVFEVFDVVSTVLSMVLEGADVSLPVGLSTFFPQAESAKTKQSTKSKLKILFILKTAFCVISF